MSRCGLLLLGVLMAGGCRSNEPAVPAQLEEVRWDQSIIASALTDQEAHYEQANLAIDRALMTRATCDFDQVPLIDVLNFVQEVSGVNMTVNWVALEIVGITPNSRVTLSLHAVPVEQILGLAIEQVSAEQFDEDKADYQVSDGVVRISTVLELESNTQTRVYDIRDLVAAHNGPPLPRMAPYDRLGPDAEQRHRQATEQLEAQMKEQNICIMVESDIQTLIQSINMTVGSEDDWLDEHWTIHELHGQLIIKTTRDSHREILNLLTSLRRARAEQFQNDARRREIFALLTQAEEHRLSQDYDAALKLIKQAQRVDPHNPEAAALREVVEETLGR